MIIPSIDIMDGKAVQLEQGKRKILERKDVISLAKEFGKYGEIAVIDLDAAFGRGSNMALIKKICALADCRVGGGIRTADIGREYLRAGAKKIIIGTKAKPVFLKNFPRELVIAALDSRDGSVLVEGWKKKIDENVKDRIKVLEPYCSEFLVTDVAREGMMRGANLRFAREMRLLTPNAITYAGSISSVKEIAKLEDMGCNAQVGMALYTGKVSLPRAFVGALDFSKGDGLLPTIVQDEFGNVLMAAFSSRESVMRSFKTGKAAYFSRSRRELWTKGESSGNYQELITARYDCDRDALLFIVRQKNFACHLGGYSCFGAKKFSLEEIYAVVKSRLDEKEEKSYTCRVGKDSKLLRKKILEEASEVVDFRNQENLVWEIADLLYFVFILMAREGITLPQIENELSGRRK